MKVRTLTPVAASQAQQATSRSQRRQFDGAGEDRHTVVSSRDIWHRFAGYLALPIVINWR